MVTNWHIAITNSRREAETCQEIGKIGFEAFSPFERCKRWRRGRKQFYERAMFPRYIFARFHVEQSDWNRIRYVDGVCDILCNNGLPQRLPSGTVETLKRAQSLGLFDRTKAPSPFPTGTKVRIDDDGPFGDFIGRVMRARAGDRVELLINYLSAELRINVPLVRLAKL